MFPGLYQLFEDRGGSIITLGSPTISFTALISARISSILFPFRNFIVIGITVQYSFLFLTIDYIGLVMHDDS